MGIPELQPRCLPFPQATREEACLVSGLSIGSSSGQAPGLGHWVRALQGVCIRSEDFQFSVLGGYGRRGVQYVACGPQQL